MTLTSVYSYYAAGGQLLYVGVTDRGIKRLHEHAESKPWWHLTVGCNIEHFETREEALDREESLIRRFRPPYNQQHNPERSLPVEDRTGFHNRRRQPRPSTAGMKQRMAAWYTASKEERAHMACAMCQEREPVNGPCCLTCQMARKTRAAIPAPTH